ncbi:diaminobutyrate--2-oxoglutarate transaminase [Paenibacillus urinalis]|uniref:Diaminobutyrate--2-oxoglutarate transaminase n=1 Tax=Paenibacillus urinalis TaxID=521520 RepID=A0ABY7X364_9BACL|nr:MULTISPECIES: diaminobutyrate--2-oxoglutarate transaminase [Paenibacillus]WDH96649.1 diaminobutyrate--2-oxoglutarate transaminase [Paenibacillus urinalis]WDI00293.1 diaminobutyrate--2-oxoglutarate transaminase [Paenibacillus urinalis]GAK40802.1 diaminobutyrate--2-oxoglutarate aminotransferase [Paenibacillus sp. TCA20]
MDNQVMEMPKLTVFNEMESEVRSYCRSFQTVFDKAKNSRLWDTQGNEYIDFFAGAGALNYGHNNEIIRNKLIDYMMRDGVTHSLDMATDAKEHFLTRFKEVILKPREWDHKVMFPGPTGTNAVESALKIARKVTKRSTVLCFTNAFHGMSLGSLSVTGNAFKRQGAGVDLNHSIFMPYDGYFGSGVDTIRYMEKMLDDPGSGIPLPAAIIVEAVQGEGGLNAASREWLRNLERLCKKKGILLILDDIQMGCGRTGTFFSFDDAGIEPDIICLSKSIGGYGLPMALTLIKPEIDIWQPGEHNGTFRGNNLGFVAAAEALNYWETKDFQLDIGIREHQIRSTLESISIQYPELIVQSRGRGMIQGLVFDKPEHAGRLSEIAFEHGLIMETSGPYSEVAKIMPPLTIELEFLEKGLEIFKNSIDQLAKEERLT